MSPLASVFEMFSTRAIDATATPVQVLSSLRGSLLIQRRRMFAFK
jgi:hypothetical protein